MREQRGNENRNAKREESNEMMRKEGESRLRGSQNFVVRIPQLPRVKGIFLTIPKAI